MFACIFAFDYNNSGEYKICKDFLIPKETEKAVGQKEKIRILLLRIILNY